MNLYAPLVYKYCRKRGLQDADAGEVTQNVLLTVSRTIGRFDYDSSRGKFRGWLGLLTRRAIGRLAAKNGTADSGELRPLDDAELASLQRSADPEWLDHFQASIYEAAVERIRPEFTESAWTVFERLCRDDGDACALARELGRSNGSTKQSIVC